MGKFIKKGITDKGTDADVINPHYVKEYEIEKQQQQKVDPILITEHQSEIQQKVDTEEELTTDKAIGMNRERYPKSSFSFWYQDTLRYTELENKYTNMAGDMYLHPSIGLHIFSVVFQEYNIIRHGLDGSELQKKMDEKVLQLHKFSSAIANEIIKERDEYLINMENYYIYISLIQEFKSELHSCLAKLGLNIKFKRKQRWEEILERRPQRTELAVKQGD